MMIKWRFIEISVFDLFTTPDVLTATNRNFLPKMLLLIAASIFANGGIALALSIIVNKVYTSSLEPWPWIVNLQNLRNS